MNTAKVLAGARQAFAWDKFNHKKSYDFKSLDGNLSGKIVI